MVFLKRKSSLRTQTYFRLSSDSRKYVWVTMVPELIFFSATIEKRFTGSRAPSYCRLSFEELLDGWGVSYDLFRNVLASYLLSLKLFFQLSLILKMPNIV